MLLHIGADVSVPLAKVLFILNARNMQPQTRAYIAHAKREHRLTNCAGDVKSYIVLRERGREQIYASHIASATLEKRCRSEVERAYINEVAVLTITD